MSSLQFLPISVSSPNRSWKPSVSFSSSTPVLGRPTTGFRFSTVDARGQNSIQHRTERNRNRNRWRIFAGESESSDEERELMLPPYNVLITGSTKGIGYALAKEFLKAGDNVVICSRSAERVGSAVQSLKEEFREQRVWGTVCDVRNANDVKALVKFARDKLKHVDIWINNAGSNAYSYKPLVEASDEDLIEVVTTNTLGLMICCREICCLWCNKAQCCASDKIITG